MLSRLCSTHPTPEKKKKLEPFGGISPVVQWLSGQVQSLVQELGSCMPQDQKIKLKKKKILFKGLTIHMDIHLFFHCMHSSRHPLSICMADTGLGILDPDKSSTRAPSWKAQGDLTE